MAQGAVSIEQIRAALATGQREAVDHLVVHPDPAVRATLAWVLAEKKDPVTVPWVFELMADVHPEVRRMAAIASGNFRLHDNQSARDPKFREIVRMLVNFRTNSDAYSRAFALSSLVNVVDRQKALYVIDLVLNDGASGHSLLGESAPSWSDENEREAVHGLIAILSSTPDEIYVKTHALKVLMAMDSPDSLGILMHYLRKIYHDTGARPSMLHYIVPHMTLPQEAENTEDVIIDFAKRYRESPDPLQQPLKVLRANLSDFYNHYQSAPFFQALNFLKAFDPDEYREYLKETREHLLLMRIIEYARSTWGFVVGALAILSPVSVGAAIWAWSFCINRRGQPSTYPQSTCQPGRGYPKQAPSACCSDSPDQDQSYPRMKVSHEVASHDAQAASENPRVGLSAPRPADRVQSEDRSRLRGASNPDIRRLAECRKDGNQEGPRPELVDSFEDPTLNRLIDRAYQNNLGVQAAALKIMEARAKLGIARSFLFPSLESYVRTGFMNGSASSHLTSRISRTTVFPTTRQVSIRPGKLIFGESSGAVSRPLRQSLPLKHSSMTMSW